MMKCTLNKHGRRLWRWEYAEVLDELRERMLREPEKLALRKKLVEHPFGTMKQAFNQGYLLLKGLSKVTENRLHYVSLQYKMGAEHSWSRTHAGFSVEVGGRRK
jgi:hypothetical protein